MAQIKKITWIDAAVRLVIGTAALRILYSVLTTAFDMIVSDVFYTLDSDIINRARLAIMFAIIMAEITLIIYVFIAAVVVEYDRYVEY